MNSVNLLNPEQKSFLDFVEKECLSHGVTLVMSENATVTVNGGECAGFFQELPKPVLSIAIGKPAQQWIEILAHEYSHLRQYVEKSPVWLNQRVHNIECSDLIDLWLNHQIELNPEQLTDYIQRIIQVEKDCEERTVAMIKSLNLPIDPIDYTRKSNAYLFFYHGVKKHRKWSKPDRGPYSRPEVVRMMPSDFNQNYENPCPILLNSLEFSFTED